MRFAEKFNQLGKKAKDAAAEHNEQVRQAIGKAAATADHRTAGKYHDRIVKAETTAGAYVERLKSTDPERSVESTPAAAPSTAAASQSEDNHRGAA